MSHNNSLNNQLKVDMKNLNDYSELVDRFFSSNKVIEVNQIVRGLLKTKLDFKTLNLTIDNNPTTWITRLFVRIFDIKEISNLQIVDNSIRFPQLTNFEFSFVAANMNKSGYYLRENNQVLNILYFDLKMQRLFFNADALAKMVNSVPGRHITENDLSDFILMMNKFADALLEDEFAIDLNVVDFENDQILYVDKVDLPVEVTDKLFLTATKNGFYVSALDNGFQIDLDKNVSLYFVQEIDNSGHAQWHYRVVDQKNEWSFLQVLQKFPFIGNWYIKNLANVEVAYRDEIFIS